MKRWKERIAWVLCQIIVSSLHIQPWLPCLWYWSAVLQTWLLCQLRVVVWNDSRKGLLQIQVHPFSAGYYRMWQPAARWMRNGAHLQMGKSRPVFSCLCALAQHEAMVTLPTPPLSRRLQPHFLQRVPIPALRKGPLFKFLPSLHTLSQSYSILYHYLSFLLNS